MLVPPTTVIQREGTSLDLSTLTAETDVASTTTAACSLTTDNAITVPLPKQKKQRTTASALEKKRVDDLKMKKHKAAAHKEAVRLYLQERAKPEGGKDVGKSWRCAPHQGLSAELEGSTFDRRRD